jgi:hypothetical protein
MNFEIGSMSKNVEICAAYLVRNEYFLFVELKPTMESGELSSLIYIIMKKFLHKRSDVIHITTYEDSNKETSSISSQFGYPLQNELFNYLRRLLSSNIIPGNVIVRVQITSRNLIAAAK